MIARDMKLRGQSLVLKLATTGKLPSEDIGRLRQATAEVGKTVEDRPVGPVLYTVGSRTYAISARSIGGTFSPLEAEDTLEPFGLHNGMLIGEPVGDGDRQRIDAVVGIVADPSEKPWRSLSESIRAAANQLKGGPPGLVAVHYSDPVSDFQNLAPLPLSAALGQLIEPWPHVAGVLLSSEPDFQFRGGTVRAHFNLSRLPADFPVGEPMPSWDTRRKAASPAVNDAGVHM
jgi:hypothetical protein